MTYRVSASASVNRRSTSAWASKVYANRPGSGVPL
jgi:hypothetical protein